MDAVRLGRVVRAIRQRHGWRQVDLAHRVGVSQSLVARVERGGAGRLRLDTIDRLAEALDARLALRIDWLGEAADRLLDAEHADVVEQLIALLRGAGWEPVPEVTFNVGGDRGSIDVLAWHGQTGTVLVVEVKTVVPHVQAMLATLDRKLRHADGIARARGWRPGRVWSLLALSDRRTSRRRIDSHASTFAARFPDRSREARRAVEHPATRLPGSSALRGLWFVPVRTRAGIRQRVARPRPRS